MQVEAERPAPRPRRHVQLRRPAAPAPDRPRGPRRRLRRRRNPLVPHAVRPRLALGGADDAAVRHRAGRGDAARARPPAGHASSTATGPRRPARSRTRCAARRTSTRPAGSRCRRSTTARSTRRRCGSACCTTRGAGGCPTPRCEQLLPNLRAATQWLTDHAAPDDDGLLKYLDESGHRAGQPGLEGLRRLHPLARRPDRRRRRSRWSRRRATPSRRPTAAAVLFEALRRRTAADGSCATWAAADARADPRPLLGRRRRRPAPGDRRRRPRPTASTASRPTWATCSGTGTLDAGRGRPGRGDADLPADARAATASARSRRTTAASTRSATTPGRCGPTTRRSARWGLMREGLRRGGAGSWRAACWPRPRQFDYRWPELYAGSGDARPARAVPGVVPAAGVVGRLRRGRCSRWRSGSRRTRPAGRARAATAASGDVRGVDGPGAAVRRPRVRRAVRRRRQRRGAGPAARRRGRHRLTDGRGGPPAGRGAPGGHLARRSSSAATDDLDVERAAVRCRAGNVALA